MMQAIKSIEINKNKFQTFKIDSCVIPTEGCCQLLSDRQSIYFQDNKFKSVKNTGKCPMDIETILNDTKTPLIFNSESLTHTCEEYNTEVSEELIFNVIKYAK